MALHAPTAINHTAFLQGQAVRHQALAAGVRPRSQLLQVQAVATWDRRDGWIGDSAAVPRRQPRQGSVMDSFQRRVPTDVSDVRPGGFKPTGRTVVITGGSQGVGRATALLFAKKGFNVVVAARDARRAGHVADDCCAAAGRQGAALAVPCDVTREEDVRALVNAALAKYDAVDLVVNCAGVMLQGAFQETSLQDFRNQLDVNFLGAVAVTQAFLPIMQKAAKRRGQFERPVIVMVGSVSGKVPVRMMPAHSAAKFALAGFTEAIREEMASYGIHIAQVHPGLVRSNFMERAEFRGMDADDKRRDMAALLKNAPFVQTPEQVAEAIWAAVAYRRNEVVVGAPFSAAAQVYDKLGVNLFGMVPN